MKLVKHLSASQAQKSFLKNQNLIVEFNFELLSPDEQKYGTKWEFPLPR